MVEAGLRGVARVAHVPLADEGGAVAGLLQELGKERGPRRDGRVVVDDAVAVGVDAGQDGRAAGRAQRRA